MEIDKILVTAIGLGLIGFIYWFFFGKKDGDPGEKRIIKDNKGIANIDIVVDGGYKPAVLFLEKGVKTKINIVRKDPNTCLGDIVLPDFKVSKYLPLNKVVNIEITPEKEGEYPFHCGMNMFHGKFVVS